MIDTLRPDNTVAISNLTVTGAATAAAALADDSDASYLTDLDGFNSSTRYAVVSFPDVSPAGAAIQSVRVRVRAASAAGGGAFRLVVTIGSQTFTVASAAVASTPTTLTYVDESSAISESDINAMTVRVGADAGGHDTQIYAVYVDVVIADDPTVEVTSPSGSVTNTNLPVVQWTPSLDPDGGGQTGYDVKIYSAAQYGAGGFNPDVTGATAASGQQTGAATSWPDTTVLANDDYRAYVRVAQTVNGQKLWSDWAYSAFQIGGGGGGDPIDPATPTITVTGQDAEGRIRIELTDNAGDIETDAFEVQRSTDAGATWVALRTVSDDGLLLDDDGVVYDWEAPNGVVTYYRARALHDYSGFFTASDWASDSDMWESTDWWLKHPTRPSLNQVVRIHSLPSHQRPARQGSFQALGSSYPVVVSDRRGSARGTLALWIDTEEEQDALDEILATGAALLLQGVPGEHWDDRYVSIGDQDTARIVDKSWIERCINTLPWTEVASPAGSIDAWPDVLYPSETLYPSLTLYPVAA